MPDRILLISIINFTTNQKMIVEAKYFECS